MSELGKAPRPRRPVNLDTQFFTDGLAEGRILLQKCAHCGGLRHPPGPLCPVCRSFDWTVTQASGGGRVHSYAVHHYPPLPGLPLPNVILLVDLDEGVRMVGDLDGRPDDPCLEIGARLSARIMADDGDDMLLVRWRLNDGGGE